MSLDSGIIEINGTDLVLTLQQKIYYSNKHLVPLQEIAESLLGLEGVIRKSPAVLNKLFPETTVHTVDVYLSEIKSGSLWETVFVKLIFGSQENLDEQLKNLRNKVGIGKIMDNNNGLSTLLLGMMLTGGFLYLKATSPEPQPNIEINNSNIISIGAGSLQKDPKELRDIIEAVVKEDKQKFADNVAKFVKPAKRDLDATITFNENEQLRIQAAAIKEIPSRVKRLPPEKTVQELENTEIQIRATDLDSFKRGWAAIIPSISEKRISTQLDIDVDQGYVMQHPNIRGDVGIEFVINKDGKKIPKRAILRKVIRPKP